jgi:hypothetical protein
MDMRGSLKEHRLHRLHREQGADAVWFYVEFVYIINTILEHEARAQQILQTSVSLLQCIDLLTPC